MPDRNLNRIFALFFGHDADRGGCGREKRIDDVIIPLWQIRAGPQVGKRHLPNHHGVLKQYFPEKLEFRVDTHSESFRPLKIAEDDATLEPPMIDDGPGVLPPRPEVAGLPELE